RSSSSVFAFWRTKGYTSGWDTSSYNLVTSANSRFFNIEKTLLIFSQEGLTALRKCLPTREFLVNLQQKFGVGIEPTRTSYIAGGAPFAFPKLFLKNNIYILLRMIVKWNP